jgi:neopullulanase
LVGRHDPDCRRAFPWDEQEVWNEELQETIRRYISLRHETPALRRGDFSLLQATDRVVVYQRRYEGQTAVIAFNNHPDAVTIACPHDFPAQLPEKLVIPTHGELFTAGKTIRLKGRTGRVWVN